MDMDISLFHINYIPIKNTELNISKFQNYEVTEILLYKKKKKKKFQNLIKINQKSLMGFPYILNIIGYFFKD